MATNRNAIKRTGEREPTDLLLEMNRQVTAAGGGLYLDYGQEYGPSIDNLLVQTHHPSGLSEDSLLKLASLAQIAVEFRGPVAVAFIWSITKIVIRVIDLFDTKVVVKTQYVEIVISRPQENVNPNEVLALIRGRNAGHRDLNKSNEEVLRASPRRLRTLFMKFIGHG